MGFNSALKGLTWILEEQVGCENGRSMGMVYDCVQCCALVLVVLKPV
jgi:hypothetical protein